MHELSLAINIVDIAGSEMKKAGATRIKTIHIEVGTLSGVIMDALDFAMKSAVRGTVLENATVNLEEIPAIARCRQCGHRFGISHLFENCPECDSVVLETEQGKELRIKSLTVE